MTEKVMPDITEALRDCAQACYTTQEIDLGLLFESAASEIEVLRFKLKITEAMLVIVSEHAKQEEQPHSPIVRGEEEEEEGKQGDIQ